MRVAYPADFMKQPDGSVLVRFPDVPEAITDGETRADAMAEAIDCLVAAFGGYINEGRDIPQPSHPRPDQKRVALPLLVAAKLALYQSMRDAHLTQFELAKRLKVGERTVRRLLDLDCESPIGQIDAALTLLGKRLEVEVLDAA